MILSLVVLVAASCAAPAREPLAPPAYLPPPCDTSERGNGHRYQHCLEQATESRAASKGDPR